MPLSRTTRWRLTLLSMLLLVGASGMYGFYKYRAHQLHLKCIAWKQNGLAAEARGDHALAVDALRQYLHYFPDDSAALAAFIAARPNVPLPNHQEISETISSLHYFVTLNPNQTDYRRQLMTLYVQIGRDTEAREAGEQLLDRLNGKDPVALRVLALTNARMKNWPKSLEALERLVKQVPTDLAAHMQRLAVMKELGKPGNEIVRLAEQLRVAAENRLADGSADPRFEVLKAVSLEVADLPTDPNPIEPGAKRDTRTVADWLRSAAAHDAPDSQFSTILVDQFNRYGMYDDAMIVLRRMADGGDQSAAAALHRRLWEMRQWAELLRRSDVHAVTQPATKIQPDSEYLAMRAFALRATSKSLDADQAVSQLAARSGDPISLAWAKILAQPENPAPSDTKSLQLLLQQVSNRDGYLDYFLGETYAKSGEPELAVKLWEQSASNVTTWSLPLERLAGTLLDRGRLDAARAAAQACAFRSKDANGNIGGTAAMTLIRVEAADLDNPSATPAAKLAAAKKLLTRVDEIQSKSPGEAFTLPIQVGVLAKIAQSEKGTPATAARDRAVSIIRATLAENQHPNDDVLLRLAAISRTYRLDMEDPCLSRYEKLHGLTPSLAAIRAGTLVSQGKNTEAVAFIRAARERKAIGDALAWDIAVGRILEMAHDSGAAEFWKNLAASNPENLGVQEAALIVPSVAVDRAFVDQAIERVKKLTGGDGITWRVARARWLLDQLAPDRSQKELAATLLNEVLKSSPEYVDAHYLLARSLEGLGDIDGAIDHLKVASTGGATANAAALNMIRLVQSRGDFDRARALLEDLARRQIGNPEQRRQAAALFAQAGKSQQAIELLEPRETDSSAPPDLLKASLYDQQNRYSEAKAACEILLQKPDVGVIQFAASLYASHGEKALADAALKQLDSLSIPPGLKESILAIHATRFGQSAEALTWFTAATQAAPNNLTTWQGLIGWQLRMGSGRDAIASAVEGLTHLPGEAVLKTVQQHADTLIKAVEFPELRPLAAATVESTSQRAAVVESLESILKSRSADAAQNVQNLRAIADKLPMLQSLQLYTIDAVRKAGRLDIAAIMAERMAYNFPTSSDGPRIAASLLLGTGQWLESIRMAELWRERSLRDAPAADVVIAQARWQLHQLPEAIKQVQSHALSAAEFPKSATHAEALAIYAGGLVLSNQPDKAYSLLDPFLIKDKSWRERWIHFATSQFDEPHLKTAIEHVAAMTDASAESEQIGLTEAWMMLSQRANGKYTPMARKQIEPMTQRPQATAGTLTAMGYVEEMENNPAAAEASYRKALGIDPSFYAANNNLAMLLVHKNPEGDAAREAVEFAKAAVKSMPVAAIYDTLAHAQAEAHDPDSAVQSMRTSLQLEPNNLFRRLNLVAMLLDFGRADEARSALGLFETFAQNGASEDVRRRSNELRLRLEGISSAATRPSAIR